MNSEPAYVRPTTSRNLLPTGRSAGYRVCRVTRLFAVAHATAVANFSDSLLLWPQLRRYCVSSNLKYIALNVCIHLSVLGQMNMLRSNLSAATKVHPMQEPLSAMGFFLAKTQRRRSYGHAK